MYMYVCVKGVCRDMSVRVCVCVVCVEGKCSVLSINIIDFKFLL